MQLLSALLQIDYQTFLTLSDDDLKEVGVSTFGARRKMSLAISGENSCLRPVFIFFLLPKNRALSPTCEYRSFIYHNFRPE